MVWIERLFSCEDNGAIFVIGSFISNQKGCGRSGPSYSAGVLECSLSLGKVV